jgi:hypothetical protein
MSSPSETPRILSMSSPQVSGAATPTERGDKQLQSKSGSKKLWSALKHAVVEHHKSVNRAYAVCYGQGMK